MTPPKAIDKKENLNSQVDSSTPSKVDKLDKRRTEREKTQQDFFHENEIADAEETVAGYHAESDSTTHLEKLEREHITERQEEETKGHELQVRLEKGIEDQERELGTPLGPYEKSSLWRDYLTFGNAWTAVKWLSAGYTAYYTVKKVTSFWNRLRGKEDKVEDGKSTDEKLKDMEDDSLRTKAKKLGVLIGTGVTGAWIINKLFIEGKSAKETYDEAHDEFIRIKKKQDVPYNTYTPPKDMTFPTPPATISAPSEVTTTSSMPKEEVDEADVVSEEEEKPKTVGVVEEDVEVTEEPTPEVIDKKASAQFETKTSGILEGALSYEEKREEFEKLSEKTTLQFGNFEGITQKYATWRISNVAQATKEINLVLYGITNPDGTKKESGFFDTLADLEKFLVDFTPRTREDMEWKRDREKTIDDMHLYIADVYAFQLNKNLRNTGLAKTLYMPYVEQIYEHNPDAANKFPMPKDPEFSDVITYIGEKLSDKEQEDVMLYWKEYGSNAFYFPKEDYMKENPGYKAFERVEQMLKSEYKNKLYYTIKGLYNAQSSLSMNKNQKKALGHFADLVGAQGFFDRNNDVKDRWVKYGTMTVCIVGGIAVTIGTAGSGAGLGATMIVGGVSGIASAYAMSYAEGRVYSTSEYLIEGLAGAVPVGIMGKFAHARKLAGITKAYQLSNQVARRLLVRETGAYMASGMALDLARASVSEYEFSWKYSVLSNLGRSLFPIALGKMQAYADELKNVPRHLLGATDEFAAEVQAEVDTIRKLRMMGKDKKAEKLLKKLNEKMSVAKAQYEQDISEAIAESKKKLEAIDQQRDAIILKSGQITNEEKKLLDKLKTQYDDLFDHHRTLEGLKLSLHGEINGDIASSIQSKLAYELDDAAMAGKPMKVNDNLEVVKREGGYMVRSKNGNAMTFSNKSEALSHVTSQLAQKPEGLAKAWMNRLSNMGSKKLDLHGETITVGKNTYKIEIDPQGNMNMIAKSGQKLTPEQMQHIAKNTEAAMIKKLDKDYGRLTAHIRQIQTPMLELFGKRLGAHWFNGPLGKKFKNMVHNSGKTLRDYTVGDFLDSFSKLKNSQSFAGGAKNFTRLLVGSPTWKGQALNTMIIAYSAATAESSKEMFMDYLRFRMLGAADLMMIFGEVGGFELLGDAYDYVMANEEEAIKM